MSIRDLNIYCIDNNKSIIVHRGMFVGFRKEVKVYCID